MAKHAVLIIKHLTTIGSYILAISVNTITSVKLDIVGASLSKQM